MDAGMGADREVVIREGGGCLVKDVCRIREKGFGRTEPGARSVPVDAMGGCLDKLCGIVIGLEILG